MNSEKIKISDVLVLGSGMAGLSFAIELSELLPGTSINVLSKSGLNAGSTPLAQGGMAVPVDQVDYASHFMDTVKSGGAEIDVSVVQRFINELPGAISRLESWGMSFDKVNGTYDRHWEGGHEVPRVLHKLDSTGKSLHDTLLKVCRQKNEIQLIENQMAYEAEYQDGIWNIKALDTKLNQMNMFCSRELVLASGGIGALFCNTTNDDASTGDILILAAQLGLDLVEMNRVQFHPTALKMPGNNSRLPLITEAIRGKGARLLNSKGERFMLKYDSRAEMATRDIVSRAIWDEMLSDDLHCVYLDLSPISQVKNKFPAINEMLENHGYDMAIDLIPVVPAAHYLCGGISADLNGDTKVPHLRAIGECARTGLHGKNRLASNSLTEALVMALLAARNIAANMVEGNNEDYIDFIPQAIKKPNDIHEKKIEILRQVLSKQLYQMYSQDKLCRQTEFAFGNVSLDFINELLDEGYLSKSLLELKHLIVLGQIIEMDLMVYDKKQSVC